MEATSLPRCLLCLVLLLHTGNSTSPIEEKVCRKTNIYDFCVKALESDPRTPRADLHTLGEIALGLALAKFADNLIYVQRMYQNSTGEALKECLHICSDEYANGDNDITDAIHALVYKDYQAMKGAVSAAEARPIACEAAFGKRHIESPLTDMNMYARNLCIISGAVADVLGE